MAIEFRAVEARPAATVASLLLNRAWTAPAIDYFPEYMEWQFSFPGPWPLPAVTAYEGTRPVGFAGTTCRRVRQHGGAAIDALVVSFVCVDPEFQGRGISAALYELLLEEVARLRCPVLTWGAPGSKGDRVLLQAYQRHGYTMQPLGPYAVFAGVTAKAGPAGEWEVVGGPAGLAEWRQALESCLETDPQLLWPDPSEDVFAHLLRDPRGRAFVAARQRTTGLTVAASVCRAYLRSVRGTEQITSVDSVVAPRNHTAAVPVLLNAAAQALPSPSPVVMATNLHGFDAGTLRASGIRQTAVGYSGYLCAKAELDSKSWRSVVGTAVEVL